MPHDLREFEYNFHSQETKRAEEKKVAMMRKIMGSNTVDQARQSVTNQNQSVVQRRHSDNASMITSHVVDSRW
jgi:hypothetical protein